MFCTNCGAKINNGAKFCGQCGQPLMKDSMQETVAIFEDNTKMMEQTPEQIKKNTLGDRITDKIASAISGGNVETIRISLEDMVELIQKHFLSSAITDRVRKDVLKAATGGSVLSPYSTPMSSVDSKYVLSSYSASHGGGRLDLLHPTDSSYIQIMDNINGKAYRYYAFTLGKAKKAIKAVINH